MEQTSSIVTPGTVIGVGNTVGILFTSIYLYNKVNQINEELSDVHDQMAKQIEVMTRLSNNNDLRDQFDDYTRNVKKLTKINNDLVDRLSSLEELYHEEHNELREIKKFLKKIGYQEESHESILRKPKTSHTNNADSYYDEYDSVTPNKYASDRELTNRESSNRYNHDSGNSNSNVRNNRDSSNRDNGYDREKGYSNQSKYESRYDSDKHDLESNNRNGYNGRKDERQDGRKSIQRSFNISDSKKKLQGERRKEKRNFREESDNRSDSEDDILSNIKKLNS